MTLTFSYGPLSHDHGPANFTVEGPRGRIMLHPFGGRLRVRLAGATLLDSTRAVLLHETGHLPVPYVPLADVDTSLLQSSKTKTECPWKGEARYWHATVGDRHERDLLWSYAKPLQGIEGIADHVAWYADRVDALLVEDDEITGHLRDPFHRVDAHRSSRHVVVRRGDEVLAETDRPLVVLETGLPPRFYVPQADVKVDLEDSDTSTTCPYKGLATYGSLPGGPADAAFSYPEPFADGPDLSGHWCFLADGITTEVDGELV